MLLTPLLLDTDESPTGARHYLTPIGRLPSVTTVLAATRCSQADAPWQRGGRAGLDARARARGVAVHDQVATWLTTGQVPLGASPFLGSLRGFVGRLQSVALVEGAVWHESGFGGRVDCVAEVDGVLSVIDWKTARSPRSAGWVADDHLQVGAYGAAVEARYGVRISRGFVVVALWDRAAQVFETGSLDDAYRGFVDRLGRYRAGARAA